MNEFINGDLLRATTRNELWRGCSKLPLVPTNAAMNGAPLLINTLHLHDQQPNRCRSSVLFVILCSMEVKRPVLGKQKNSMSQHGGQT